MVLNGFKSKIFLTKSTGTGILNTDDSRLKKLIKLKLKLNSRLQSKYFRDCP